MSPFRPFSPAPPTEAAPVPSLRVARKPRKAEAVKGMLEFLYPDLSAQQAVSTLLGQPCPVWPLSEWDKRDLRRLELAADAELLRREQARHARQMAELDQTPPEQRQAAYESLLR